MTLVNNVYDISFCSTVLLASFTSKMGFVLFYYSHAYSLFLFQFVLSIRYTFLRFFISIFVIVVVVFFVFWFWVSASSWLPCVHFVALCFMLSMPWALSVPLEFAMNLMVLGIRSSWSSVYNFFFLPLSLSRSLFSIAVGSLFVSIFWVRVKLMAFPLCWNTRPHLFKGKTFFALTRHHIKHHLCQCELSCFTFAKILMENYRYTERVECGRRKARTLFSLFFFFY